MRINFRSSWVFRNADNLVAAIAGFILIQLFTRHSGIGVSPDSVTYLSVASHIHDRGAWTDFHGDPLIDFPGFYPLFLAIVQWVSGMQTLRSAPVLNGLLFAALISFCGWLMRGSFRSQFCRWALLILIVTSPCLLEVYTMLWSETLFLFLLLLFLYLLDRYFQKLSASVLIVAGLIAGLAFVTRYAGLTLQVTGGLLLLLQPGKKLKPILLFGSCASLLPLINLVHNGLTGGAPIGHREGGLVSFGANLHDFGTVFCDWLHIPNDHYFLASAIGMGFVLLFLLACALKWVQRVGHIAVTYFIVYALFILLSATFSRFQPLDSRLLSPLFVPWLWGSTALLSEWMGMRKPSRSGSPRKIRLVPLILLATALLTGQCLTDRGNWEDQMDSGVPGYTDDDWRGSPTMAALRRNSGLPSRPYSNAYDAIWFLGGMQADLLPHKENAREQYALLAKDSLCVVWFNDGVNPDLVDIAWISRYKKLYSQQPFDDGAIYLFTGKQP